MKSLSQLDFISQAKLSYFQHLETGVAKICPSLSYLSLKEGTPLENLYKPIPEKYPPATF